ncbi:NAD(P)-binding protein [Basidiobolus meristosporus CBS 931.73]|uniref:NAD(P)-binding protein n=1 Tax=Basidiobolus meristosporus CBS 931.73 TaxID=1314790 RepID=A0A1Y1VS46_9FUNG|nr:NAD(P)-binding protein [Basidiobolus meristosporus CBS 931.73]|eukprot:ORX63836.1 NAD(P)-binding protein [Basidiobolus meristosporus CBS 931.73]
MPTRLCIVTGAARGFGLAIVKQYVAWIKKQPTSNLHLVVLGRDAAQVEDLTNSLQNDKVKIQGVTGIDLTQVDKLEGNVETLFSAAKNLKQDLCAEKYFETILINNAGSLGDLSTSVSEYKLDLIKEYFDFNVVSFTYLCSQFLKTCDDSFTQSRTIVNISSLLAVKAFPNWGLYAAGKAARDQLMGVIAEENRNNNTRTLSYAPGPLDNDMQRVVRETINDEEQRSIYSNMHHESKLVKMDDSAEKLCKLLFADNGFVSGSHIDYYDV